MGTWNSPPQVPSIPHPPHTGADLKYVEALYQYTKDLANVLSAMKNDLEYMLNGTLDANNIRSNSIETKNLKAGSVTAEKIQVDQLSAISANLGTITAGLIQGITIIGSLIQTATAGQRVEMDINGLRSMDATGQQRVEISPNTPTHGVAGVQYTDENGVVRGVSFANSANHMAVTAANDLRLLAQAGSIIFTANSINTNGTPVNFTNSNLDFSNASLNMPQKANAFSGYTGSISVVVGIDFANQIAFFNTFHISNGIITNVT